MSSRAASLRSAALEIPKLNRSKMSLECLWLSESLQKQCDLRTCSKISYKKPREPPRPFQEAPRPPQEPSRPLQETPKTPPQAASWDGFWRDCGFQFDGFRSQLGRFVGWQARWLASHLTTQPPNQSSKHPTNQPTEPPDNQTTRQPDNQTSRHPYFPRPGGGLAEGNWIR